MTSDYRKMKQSFWPILVVIGLTLIAGFECGAIVAISESWTMKGTP